MEKHEQMAMIGKKEYIEREALKRDLIDNRSFYPAIVKCAIESAPAADVVEVVRCGKCVHFEEHKGAKYGVCLYYSEICDTPVHMTAEDYCSHGEENDESVVG